MGKISNYTRVLVAKLQDVFAIDSTDNNVTTTKSVTVEQIGDTIAGTQVHSDLKTDSQTIIGGINELAKDKNVADEYDDTHTYNTGDITIYGNTLYICTANNTTGDFDPSKWTATTIDNVIGSLSTLTTTVKSSIVGAVNEVVASKPNIFVSDNIMIGTVTAGTKYDLYTLSNLTGGKITQFSDLKGLMYLGGGGNSLSYGYLFCSPANNIISYIPQVSDNGVAIKIAVLY